MSRRPKAFGLHLLGSAIVLTLVLGGLYLGWYRWPGWYLAGASAVAAMVLGVDLALGPLMTLIIANPRKPQRELARDISIIVLVQLSALVYGSVTLWQGRPLYYTFSADRLEMVQASELEPKEIVLAQQQNPAFAPHWYSLPRWIWAPLPADKDEAARIMSEAVVGGTDVIQMPRYFKPWDDGLRDLAKQLHKVDDAKVFSPAEKQALKRRMTKLGFPPDQPITLTMWGKDRPLIAVVDRANLRIVAIIKAT
jgi:Fe2+ transport system protein FeoA